MNREALIRQVQSRGHAADPAAHHQRGFVHRNAEVIQGLQKTGLSHRHAHQVHALLGGRLRFVLMDPGTLVADVGHLEEIFVQRGVAQHVLKGGLVGSGRAGRHHHPVEPVLLDHLPHLVLGVLGAGKQVGLGIFDIGESFGVFHHRGHIRHLADIKAAVADKYPDPGELGRNVPLRRKDLFPDQGVPGLGQQLRRGCRGRAAFHHRLGDIFGAVKEAAGKYPRPGGGNRLEALGVHEPVVAQFDAQFVGQSDGVRAGDAAHRQDHQVENLVLGLARFRNIVNAQVAVRQRLDAIDPGADQPGSLVFDADAIFFKILPGGAHVHVK